MKTKKMNNRGNHETYFFRSLKGLFLLMVLFLIPFSSAFAQRDLPVRPYTDPDARIAFERDTPFQDAIQILDTYAQKYDEKFIVDRTGASGPINLNLPMMHWEDALHYILSVRGLAIQESPDFYEIVQPPQADNSGSAPSPGPAQRGPAGGQGQLPITAGSKEVRISATFFEGNRRILNEIGVDWSTLQDGVVQVNNLGASSVTQEVFTAQIFPQSLANGIEVEALFSAFEANNFGEVLATPTIKVLDGKEGEVQIGQDLPILQRDFAGNTTTEFVEVGSILSVIPQVITYNDTTFIYMQIEAERSSGQPGTSGLVVNKQNAESEILLLNGESTVIAGLYSTQENIVRRGIPILKDLPPWLFGLRYLFGFSTTDTEIRELVILIKAELDPGIPERMKKEFRTPGQTMRKSRQDLIAYTEELLDPKEIIQAPESTSADEMVQTSDTASGEPDNDPGIPADTAQMTEEPDTSPDMDTTAIEEAETDPFIEKKPFEGDVEIMPEDPYDDSAEDQEDQSVTEEVESEAEEEPEEEPEVSLSAGTYYIIAGAFANRSNAELFRNQLIKDGYDAVILQKNGIEYDYVAYRSYKDPGEAKSALLDIQQYENPDAWLYVSD